MRLPTAVTVGDSRLFQEAKKKYEAKHPDIEIVINNYRGNGLLGEEDYEKK